MQPAAGSTILFKLPRELRDKIYHELWRDGPLIKQRYGRVKYDITYTLLDHSQWPVTSNKHPWLLTNKQTLHEGIEQLHTRSIWHMFYHHERKTKRVNYIFPLLTPGRAQHVSMHLNTMRSNLNLNVKTAHRMVNKILSDPHASSLRSIRVSMYCNGGPFGVSNKPFHCNFSPLERLQTLENLEQFLFQVQGDIHVGAPDWQHLRYEHNAQHPTFDGFWEETKQLARLLIPNYEHEVMRVNQIHPSGLPSRLKIVFTRSSFRFTTREYYYLDGVRYS